MDNAWLAASLMTIRAYGRAEGHPELAQKADAILADMDFRQWYHPDTQRFSWGAREDPQGGGETDLYSNENRIINLVARALGDLTKEEFAASIAALDGEPGSYAGHTVAQMAWDGSIFTYLAPALFIREAGTSYGRETLLPMVQAQRAYAANEGYAVWGLSDCFDIGAGGYVQQGAPPDYKRRSDRFSAIAQAWLFLALVNHEAGVIWEYFYLDEGVLHTHVELYGKPQVALPLLSA